MQKTNQSPSPDAPAKRDNTFEGNYKLINELIEKQRGKWTLTALVSFDFSDVKQVIMTHIHNKWHLLDFSKPIGPYISRTISNQISNLIESKYSNYTKPCMRCESAIGDNGCEIYSQQCSECPLYQKWMKSKGNALSTKLPVSMEDHEQEVYDLPDMSEDLTDKIPKFHELILPLLAPNERLVYQWAYIEEKEDTEVKALMETVKMDKDVLWRGKLKIIKFNILQKAKEVLKEADL